MTKSYEIDNSVPRSEIGPVSKIMRYNKRTSIIKVYSNRFSIERLNVKILKPLKCQFFDIQPKLKYIIIAGSSETEAAQSRYTFTNKSSTCEQGTLYFDEEIDLSMYAQCAH